MVLCQACIWAHTPVITTSTIICLNSISKGPGLLTKNVFVCKGCYRVRHIFLYTFILLPLSQFPNFFMFPLYFIISSWMNWFENRRILHPVALLTYVENDCKKKYAEHNIVHKKMFHSHIAWGKTSIGNDSQWTTLFWFSSFICWAL